MTTQWYKLMRRQREKNNNSNTFSTPKHEHQQLLYINRQIKPFSLPCRPAWLEFNAPESNNQTNSRNLKPWMQRGGKSAIDSDRIIPTHLMCFILQQQTMETESQSFLTYLYPSGRVLVCSVLVLLANNKQM